MGVSGLLTAGAAAAALALGNSVFEGSRWEIGLGAAFSLGTGLALSLGRPEAQPVPLAIELNRLIDQSLAAENARIADENARRRRNVRVTIVQVTQ